MALLWAAGSYCLYCPHSSEWMPGLWQWYIAEIPFPPQQYCGLGWTCGCVCVCISLPVCVCVCNVALDHFGGSEGEFSPFSFVLRCINKFKTWNASFDRYSPSNEWAIKQRRWNSETRRNWADSLNQMEKLVWSGSTRWSLAIFFYSYFCLASEVMQLHVRRC